MSQRLPITALENVVSNAERRAFLQGEPEVVPRVSDVFASLPSLTGKIELEYEGELKGAEQVARELVRQAVATVFDAYAADLDTRDIVDWFNDGGQLDLTDTTPATALLDLVAPIGGMADALESLGAGASAPPPSRAAAADFLLEGLCALRRISRSDEGRMLGTPAPARKAKPQRPEFDASDDEDEDVPRTGRKKYYN